MFLNLNKLNFNKLEFRRGCESLFKEVFIEELKQVQNKPKKIKFDPQHIKFVNVENKEDGQPVTNIINLTVNNNLIFNINGNVFLHI